MRVIFWFTLSIVGAKMLDIHFARKGRTELFIMPPVVIYLILGVFAGVLSGMIGVGGGILLVPAFIYFLGMTQHQAQGTTLALFIPPIGILGAYVYYREGNVDLTVAAFVCLGFFFGSLFGAQMASAINNDLLRRIFGVILLLVSLKMLFQK